jgi:hypothetical protein
MLQRAQHALRKQDFSIAIRSDRGDVLASLAPNERCNACIAFGASSH